LFSRSYNGYRCESATNTRSSLEPLIGTPAGGTFSGTGVVGGSFDPATAGVGTTTITYTITDANGCTGVATTDIVVNPLPTPDAGTYGPLCIDNGLEPLIGTPAGEQQQISL